MTAAEHSYGFKLPAKLIRDLLDSNWMARLSFDACVNNVYQNIVYNTPQNIPIDFFKSQTVLFKLVSPQAAPLSINFWGKTAMLHLFKGPI